MNRIITQSVLIAALIAISIIAMGQVTITNSGSMTISGTSPVAITGNFANTSSAAWTNNGDLTITGNITNDQAGLAPGTGTTRLAGTTIQTIAGGQPFMTNNLVLTNSAGYTLNQSLQVAGTATFTNGIVTATTAATPMIFGANATLSGVSNTSHVNGYVRYLGTSLFSYPVGDAGNYRRIDLTPSANAAGIDCRYFKTDAGSASFTGGGTNPTPLVAYNKSEYWDLTPVSTATSTVTIYYDQVISPGSINSTSDLKVAHLSGGNWLDEGGTASGTTSAGNITSNAVSTWSPFTLGSSNLASPLPVVLTGFSGLLVNNAVQLSWEVADEVNLRAYGVQKSCNGSDYTTLGEVTATNSRFYQYTDATPSCQQAYYRLRMEDIDGKYTYSQVVLVNSAGSNGIHIMPNPVENQLLIRFGTGTGGSYAIDILDMDGRKVFNSERTVSDGETISLARPSQIQTGSYILSLRNLEKGTLSSFKLFIK